MTDYDKTVNFKASSETVKEAKARLEHGEMSEELRSTLTRIAHGEDVAEERRLKDRLDTLRGDRRDKRREREQIEEEIEEINRDIDRVEERLDVLRDQDGEYDGVLAMLEADLSEGVRVTVGAPKIKEAARIAGCDPEDVIEDLKERNPDIPDRAFRSSRPDEDPKWKDTSDTTLTGARK